MQTINLISLYGFNSWFQELTYSHCQFGKKCHMAFVTGCYDTDGSRDNLSSRINPKETKMPAHRFFSLFIVLTVAVLFALVPQDIVFAGKSVDPATLNPLPPPEFNPICETIGSGTICHLAFTDPSTIAAGTGIMCSTGNTSFEVLDTSTRSVDGRRYYDQNGNLTQRHFREVIVGTLTNSLTHVSVSYTQGDTIIHNLAIPGDASTGTQTITGSLRIYASNGGTVLVDVGRSVMAADGTILKEAGQHPLNAYFVFGDTSALQPLCDALQ
jgi:hypothetical protein